MSTKVNGRSNAYAEVFVDIQTDHRIDVWSLKTVHHFRDFSVVLMHDSWIGAGGRANTSHMPRRPVRYELHASNEMATSKKKTEN